jgi:tetratricopeptide (TPR) repeat protein
MTPQSSEQSIFLHAIGLPSPADRAAYLDAVCLNNPGLRAEVDALLSAHDRLGGALPPTTGQELAACAAAAANEAAASGEGHAGVGTVLSGRYKLVEEIGEGGMGTVWMAQQTEPVRRLVALKVIKPGMDSKQVLARFEAERQALALMEHANIARVLDGGSTATGRPYFVMELVKGVPLTRYCDERRLTPRQRLELFVPVCQAVQHAHQKGVIHRDLKPSNVLVALYDGKPVPKVIDFGIAKATGQQLTERTLITGFGAVVGTLEYMSPEQAELNQLDIDTRSDIYSLGVLLYELLTGTTPLDRKRLKEAAMLEVLRIIREVEPPKPSTRLSTTDELPSVAANRGLEPKKLTGLVRGELDWVVMKCLDKDRNRRYETANGLALDIQRYLSDEAVLACPPSTAYRLRKFARRNRGRLTVAAVIMLFLVILGATAAWVAWDRTQRQHTLAIEVTRALDNAENSCTRDDVLEALASVRQAQALLKNGTDDDTLLARASRVGGDVKMAATLEDIRLKRSTVKNDHWSVASPLYAEAFAGYGVDLATLGPDEAAERIQASAIRDRLLAALDDWLVGSWRSGPPDKDRLLVVLARADRDPWRNSMRMALVGGKRQALKTLSQGEQAKAQSPATLGLLADALHNLGDDASAVAVLRAAQERHPSDFWLNQNLGYLLTTQKSPRPAEAVGYLRAALALRPTNPGVYVNLGLALGLQGDKVGESAAFQKAIDLKPDYGIPYYNLGSIHLKNQDMPRASAAYQKAIDVSPGFRPAYVYLAEVLVAQKKYPEAERVIRKALELKDGVVDNVADTHMRLGNILVDQKKYREAEAAFRRAIALKRFLPLANNNLAFTLIAQNRYTEAEGACRKAIALDGEYHWAYVNLGEVLQHQKKYAEAEKAARKAIALKDDLPEAHYTLGHALDGQERYADAEAAYRRTIALKQDYPEAHNNLGNALLNQEKWTEAELSFRKAIDLRKDYARAHGGLGDALARQGRHTEAEAAYRRTIALKQDYPEAHNHLGNALFNQEKWTEAELSFRKAIDLRQDYASAHRGLGDTLIRQNKYAEAEVVVRKAIALEPKNADVYVSLGMILVGQKKPEQAEKAYRKALALQNDHALAHFSLGALLKAAGNLPGAIASYRKAIASKRDFAEAHCHLGDALDAAGDREGASAAFQDAIILKPKDARYRFNLGNVLTKKGDLPGAIAAYRKAIELQHDHASAYYSLGLTLDFQGDHEGAIAAYEKAIAINPGFAEAHCNLGNVLRWLGKFRLAVVHLRRGHELGSRNPLWRHPSLKWLQSCERLIELDDRLPAVLAGTSTPSGPAERIEFAELCCIKGRNRDAVRFYKKAFAALPALEAVHCYHAACAAALAAAGKGTDARPDDSERAGLRQQALDWLRAELKVVRMRLAAGTALDSQKMRTKLVHWQRDADLAGVRDAAAIQILPLEEQNAWRTLWADVARLLREAGEATTPPQK